MLTAGNKRRIRTFRDLFAYQEDQMVTNKPAGDGHRNGAVRKRSQLKDGLFGKETKRDLSTGEFMVQKKDRGKFKGVRKVR
jgi:hypothetical protein